MNNQYEPMNEENKNTSKEVGGHGNHSGHMGIMIITHILPLAILFLVDYFKIDLNSTIRTMIFMIIPLSHVGMMFFMKKPQRKDDEDQSI